MRFPKNRGLRSISGTTGLIFFKISATEKMIQAVYKKALEAIGLTQEDFESKEFTYMYRANVRNDMRAHLSMIGGNV